MNNHHSQFAKIDFDLLLKAGEQRRQNLLALPNVVEQAYRQSRQQQLLNYRRLCIVFGLILVALTDLGEIFIFGGAWNKMVVTSYLIYALLLIIFLPIITSAMFLRYQDTVLCIIGALLLFGSVVVLHQGMPAVTVLYNNVLLLIFVYMVAMLRLGLFYALWVLVVALIGFNLLIIGIEPQSLPIVFNYNIFFLLLGAIVLYANYSIDIYSRRHFLQNLAIARERENIKDIKIKLRTMASVDRLTGVMNHQEMYKSLNSEWRRLCRNDADLSLVLIGVDDFRAYNGCFGHKAGDEVLIKVARCIGDTFKRASDVVARFEGELFLVMMPETGAGEAELMARSILKRIAELGIEHPQSSVADVVTASIGVASCRPDMGGAYEDLLAQVKDALETAKAQGKARYFIAQNLHGDFGKSLHDNCKLNEDDDEFAEDDDDLVPIDEDDSIIDLSKEVVRPAAPVADDYDDDDEDFIDDDDDLVPIDEDDSIIDLSHETIPAKRPL